MQNLKNRDEIIESMCLTWRHDYGLEKGSFSGMTKQEKESLRRQMSQVFDNDIAPYMDFKRKPRRTELVHDGIIKIHSFELTDREKRRISLGLRYGPAAAAMKDDGTFFESEPSQRDSWKTWIFRKFLGKS